MRNTSRRYRAPGGQPERQHARHATPRSGLAKHIVPLPRLRAARAPARQARHPAVGASEAHCVVKRRSSNPGAGKPGTPPRLAGNGGTPCGYDRTPCAAAVPQGGSQCARRTRPAVGTSQAHCADTDVRPRSAAHRPTSTMSPSARRCGPNGGNVCSGFSGRAFFRRLPPPHNSPQTESHLWSSDSRW